MTFLLLFCTPQDCEYSTLPPDSPALAVKDMSIGGAISFEADVQVCNSLTVKQWMYQLDKPGWNEGHPNNFRVNADRTNSQRWSLQVNTNNCNFGMPLNFSWILQSFTLFCLFFVCLLFFFKMSARDKQFYEVYSYCSYYFNPWSHTRVSPID